jgi:hypothetical protein
MPADELLDSALVDAAPTKPTTEMFSRKYVLVAGAALVAAGHQVGHEPFQNRSDRVVADALADPRATEYLLQHERLPFCLKGEERRHDYVACPGL